MKNILAFIALGLLTGILNGLFGAGGGMTLIPLLKMRKIDGKESHATCLVVILILSLVSIYSYYGHGFIDFKEAMRYIPFGIIGAVAGGFIMPRISIDLLRKSFGVLMFIFGVRMFF